MPEIGPTLREARMRAQLDITEVELATKIRAKYLRALENEEWGLLPGPTFVRSFLRTYAQYLGLDAKLLVEEYRRQYEGYTDLELGPARGRRRQQPAVASGRRASRPPRRPFVLTRAWIVGLTLAGVVALLFVIGVLGGKESPDPTPKAGTTTSTTGGARTTTASERRTTRRTTTPATAKRVALTIVPSSAVWVCLVDARGKRVIPGSLLEPGTAAARERHRSSSFKLTLGHGGIALTVNGKRVEVPASSNPVGYEITPKGSSTLPEAERPTCQ